MTRMIERKKPAAASAKSKSAARSKPVVKSQPAVKAKAKPAPAKSPEPTPAPAKAAASKPAAAAVPKSPFGVRELRQYRDFLLELREKLTGQITTLVKDSLTLSPAEGDVDYRSEEEGTESFDRDFVLTRASSDQDVVFEIDEALNRIEIGTFGVCETCLKNIEKPRLQAIPYSRLCVRCKGEWEQGQQRRRTYDPPGLFPTSDKNADAGDEE
jgi:RNA polymerase-binding transcription factor DksA